MESPIAPTAGPALLVPGESSEVPSGRLLPRRRGGLSAEWLWVGSGVAPGGAELDHAVAVMSAVPLAGAAGWSVRGRPWSVHARPLRTAVVRPDESWSITVMRGVREVDELAGVVLARRVHVERLDIDPDLLDSLDAVHLLSQAMRSSGFRLLHLG